MPQSRPRQLKAKENKNKKQWKKLLKNGKTPCNWAIINTKDVNHRRKTKAKVKNKPKKKKKRKLNIMSCILTGSGFRNEVMNFCVNMTKCPLRLHMRVALDVSPVSIWGEATDLRKLGAWGSKCHHSKNWDDTKEPYGDDLEIGNIELVWKNVSQLF